MHLNVKAKINLILNDFQLILKSNGVELMCKVKRLQFYSLQTKTSLFFLLYSIYYFFYSTTVFRSLYVTLPVLVRIIGPTMQNISIHWTEQQMGLHEYYIIHGYWIRDALKTKYLVCCGSASVMTFILAAGLF